MNEEQLRENYKLDHSQLEWLYYGLEEIDKREFDTMHRALWDKFKADLAKISPAVSPDPRKEAILASQSLSSLKSAVSEALFPAERSL